MGNREGRPVQVVRCLATRLGFCVRRAGDRTRCRGSVCQDLYRRVHSAHQVVCTQEKGVVRRTASRRLGRPLKLPIHPVFFSDDKGIGDEYLHLYSVAAPSYCTGPQNFQHLDDPPLLHFGLFRQIHRPPTTLVSRRSAAVLNSHTLVRAPFRDSHHPPRRKSSQTNIQIELGGMTENPQ